MYFEDTDLCKRLKHNGYKLLVEPRAKVVHNFNQSGGPAFYDFKKASMLKSRDIFLQKHINARIKALQRILTKPPGKKNSISIPSLFTSPFRIGIPKGLRKKWLFEWSPNADFIPGAGRFGSGPMMEFSKNLWSMLSPGQYYGRIGNPDVFFQKYHLFSWKKFS
jgi:hypothetical protein